MDEDDRFVGLTWITKRYGISAPTVWRWAANGKLPPAQKFGGLTRWRVSDLLAWEKNQPTRK